MLDRLRLSASPKEILVQLFRELLPMPEVKASRELMSPTRQGLLRALELLLQPVEIVAASTEEVVVESVVASSVASRVEEFV